jgi:thiol-disulfide isomerase/thioredoxin
MLKTLMALAILTTLASCTMPGATPAPVTPTKQMAPDAMISKDAMPKTDVMTPEAKMMSGSDAMNMEKTMMTPDTMPKTDTMMKDDKMMTPDAMPKTDTMMKKESGYHSYTPELVASALQSWQKVALFFYAGWCPSCRSLDGAINSSLSSISADTLIIKVDYDTSTELKKKYGVVTQHTTVVLNSDGTLASKKLGAKSVTDILN